SDAKPYDYVPKSKSKSKDTDKDKKDADKDTDKDKKDTDKDADKDKEKDADKDKVDKDADKEKDPGKESSKSGDKTYDDYPDYQFLKALDKDGDEKISRKEWDAWAKDYVTGMKPILDAQRRIEQAERKLASHKPGTKQYRQAEAELRQEREAYQR